MSATSTAPAVDPKSATREEAEAALADVRQRLGDLRHAGYSQPDLGRSNTPQAREYWRQIGILSDMESTLERRLRILDNQEAAAEAAPAPTVQDNALPVITLPVGVDPAVVPADLKRKFEDCTLAVAEKKPGAAKLLADVERQLVEVTEAAHQADEAARREAAIQAARQRRAEQEAEAARVLAAGEAAKRRVEAQAALEEARRKLRKISIEWAAAANDLCALAVEAHNDGAAHVEATVELKRAVQTVSAPFNRRLASELGGWRSVGGRPVRLNG
jgi:DNA repair exonuclease SbcCD ATPase subunit